MIINAILTRTIAHAFVIFIMKLEELEKKRDAYAGKIVNLAIKVAVIFIVPILIISGISYLSDIKFMYLFPLAFITSWTGVILLYRKISKEVRALDARIKQLRAQETNSDILSNDIMSESK